ncbi:MAG: c-type cytochrome [Pseudanabaena sp. RU_4_16]|nr:c-type cytochrome [Pseudanabaena sp. RU_4_16]
MKLLSTDRKTRRWLILIVLITLAFVVSIFWQRFQTSQTLNQLSPEQVEVDRVKEPIQPIPFQIAMDRNKVLLGEKLFQDVRLSSDKQISCSSCHSLRMSGADRRTYSIGVGGAPGEVNTPTVLNVRFNFRLNWNGKHETLPDHLDALLVNPKVMDMQWDVLIPNLQMVPDYVREFTKIYSDGITQPNIKDAIATYQRSLYTPNARFDRFLRGNKQALTTSEQEGYRMFKAYGCVSCHQGVNVGGNMFARFGEVGDYFTDRGNVTQVDLGRFNVTHDRLDRFVFRVPSLRNVALTPPYFHDGTAKSLEEAIAIMSKYQLGRVLPPAEASAIAQFLRTLTGEYQGKAL